MKHKFSADIVWDEGQGVFVASCPEFGPTAVGPTLMAAAQALNAEIEKKMGAQPNPKVRPRRLHYKRRLVSAIRARTWGRT